MHGAWPGFLLVVLAAWPVLAQDVRFANGATARGAVKSVSPDGMELELGGQAKLYPWSAFSAGTRFRYDPVYRANLAVIQAGQPASARTNEPESGYLTTPSSDATGSVPGANPMAPAPTTLQRDSSSGPLNLEAYEPAPALPRANIPKLELRNGDAALSWGVRYGRGTREIAYFVFDVKEPGELPDALVMHSAADERTDRIKATRRGDGSEATAQFRKLRFEGTFGEAKAGVDLSCAFSARSSAALNLTADVELTRGTTVCAFSLSGQPAGALQGAGDIAARELVTPPSLWMAIEGKGGRAAVVGNVRMGRFKLLPRRGMETAVSVTVSDEGGKPVLERAVPLQNASLQDRYTITLPLDQVQSGRKYALKASIDLGPLLGRVRYEESFVVP